MKIRDILANILTQTLFQWRVVYIINQSRSYILYIRSLRVFETKVASHLSHLLIKLCLFQHLTYFFYFISGNISLIVGNKYDVKTGKRQLGGHQNKLHNELHFFFGNFYY